MGEDIDVLYDFINSGDPERRDWCNKNVRDELLMAKQDRVTGDYNEFWAGATTSTSSTPLKAATLMAHAFNDWNVMPEHSVRIYEALKKKGVPCMAFFHQGGHGGPPPLELMNKWFTRYLYGVENGVENEPRSWIVREDDRPQRADALPDYPHPEAKHVSAAPRQAATERRSAPSVDRRPGEGQQTLVDDVSKLLGQEAREGRRVRSTACCSRRPSSRRPCTSRARDASRSDSPRTRRSQPLGLARLAARGRRRAITDNIITRGWADPQNHESESKSAPLEARQVLRPDVRPAAGRPDHPGRPADRPDDLLERP